MPDANNSWASNGKTSEIWFFLKNSKKSSSKLAKLAKDTYFVANDLFAMRDIITAKDALEQSITLQSAGKAKPSIKADTYIEKIIKYIPAETVSAYLLIQKSFEQFNKSIPYGLYYIVFFIVLVANPFYLKKIQNVKRWSLVIITSIAFIIWAYTLGEPFRHLMGDDYQPGYSVIGILLFSFLAPLLTFQKF